MKKFKDFINEDKVNNGLVYELKVYNAMSSVKIPGLKLGSKPVAGFSNQGAGDLEATLNNKPFNIEIKATSNDQMGGGSFSYDMATKSFKPIGNMNPDDVELLMPLAHSKIDALNDYIMAAKKIEPVIYHKNITGIPIKVSKAGRDILKNNGLLAKINSKINTNVGFIIRHYNKKGVYYIQVGGAGLFYMGSNPLHLPIPELIGEINVEMRLAYSGGKLTFPTKPPTEARSAGLRFQGRLVTKGKSPYSLDNTTDILKLFSK